jgi:hypothetical protein
MTISVYTFVRDGHEFGSFSTQDYTEAKQYAAENRCLVIANEFEWAGSEPLDDFRTVADKRRSKSNAY